jgi:hypothetical protein
MSVFLYNLQQSLVYGLPGIAEMLSPKLVDALLIIRPNKVLAKRRLNAQRVYGIYMLLN